MNLTGYFKSKRYWIEHTKGNGMGQATGKAISPINPLFWVDQAGDVTFFALEIFRNLGKGIRSSSLVSLLVQIGVRSLGVILFTGAFIGMVLAIQAQMQLAAYGISTRLGQMVNLSVVRELGPVLAAVMLSGRVGGAIAAELATMRMSEQIDAMACMGVDPIAHLVAPRFWACLLLVPMMTIFANFMGMLGGWFVATELYFVEPYHYWYHARNHVSWWDHTMGMTKAVFFGGAIGLFSCHRGMSASGGAQGVGRAATSAFVACFIAIMTLDFFLGLFFSRITPLVAPVPRGNA